MWAKPAITCRHNFQAILDTHRILLIENILQRFTIDEIHNEIGNAIIGNTKILHRNEIRMIQMAAAFDST